jgi:hypothetical protein
VTATDGVPADPVRRTEAPPATGTTPALSPTHGFWVVAAPVHRAGHSGSLDPEVLSRMAVRVSRGPRVEVSSKHVRDGWTVRT